MNGVRVSYVANGQLIEEEYRYLVDFLNDVVKDDYVDDTIDETNPEVDVCGMKYCASRVLKELDPIAYSMVRDDVINMIAEDIEYELNHYSDVEEFEGYKITPIDSDYDADEEN